MTARSPGFLAALAIGFAAVLPWGGLPTWESLPSGAAGAGGPGARQLAGVEAEVHLYRSSLQLQLETKDGRRFPISVNPAAVVEVRRSRDAEPVSATVRLAVLDGGGESLWEGARPDVSLTAETSVEFPLAEPLPGARAARLWIETDGGTFERDLDLGFHRVHGRVTDFDGRPTEAPAYVLFESRQNDFVAAVACDERGYFEIEVPERRYHTVWAVDEQFGHSTLERYAHDVSVYRDLDLGLRIGEIEVYRLSATVTAERTILADFSVFSIGHFVDPLVEAQARSGGEVRLLDFIGDPGHYPPIEADTVELFLDDRPLTTWTVERRWSSMAGYGARDARRPYWTVEAALPETVSTGVHALRVVVSSPGPDGQVERGEASFHGLRVW